MSELEYPSTDRIAELNVLVLSVISVKKADKAQVLSWSTIEVAINACREQDGDIYLKAAVLMRMLVQKHPFASGNRRTAFVTAKDFLHKNGHKIGISDDAASAKVMQGVRENYYTDQEITEWIHHGKIRQFKR